MSELAGKVAIITGSTQGLGEGIARRLCRAGASVVINGRSEEKGVRVAKALAAAGGEVEFVCADVSRKGDAQRLVATAVSRFGRVDILVNNAQAQSPLAAALDPINDDYINTTFASGLMGSLWAAQAAVPHMKKTGAGRIINFASLNGVYGAKFGVAYNVTKEAIRGLTRTLANEWGPFGITVNTVMPSGLSPAYEAFFKDNPKRANASAKMIPMRRHGHAEDDVGSAILGLISDHARFITGQSFFVDGGQSLVGLPQLHTLETRETGEPAP